MADAWSIGAVVIFFVVAMLYAAACDRLGRS